MNNIHEKDWAEDAWSGHTGMDSASDYCNASEQNRQADKTAGEPREQADDAPLDSEASEH